MSRRQNGTYVKVLHRFDKSPGTSRCICSRIVKFETFKVSMQVRTKFKGEKGEDLLGRRIAAAPCRHLVYRLHEMSIYPRTHDGFHHGQMLKVIVRLEQGVACEEFDQDTTNAPDITGKRPSQSQDNFWSSVMPC